MRFQQAIVIPMDHPVPGDISAGFPFEKKGAGGEDGLFAVFFYANPVPMIALDAVSLRILETNEAAQQFYGYSREEFLRMEWRSLATGPSVELPSSSDKQLHRRKGGRTVSVEARCRRIAVQGWNIELAVIRDLSLEQSRECEHLALVETERRVRAEAEAATHRHGEAYALLQAQREHERLLFNSVPAMIWCKDDRNNIIRANRVAAEALGLSIEEIEGKNTAELYPNEAESYFADDVSVLESGIPKHGIVEPITLEGGEKHWVRTDKIPYRNPDGKRRGVMVFSVDISEQKRAQEDLRRVAQDLARSNRDLEEFASVISHDLQEPLRMTHCYLRLIMNRYPRELPAEAREFMEFAMDGAIRMKEMLDNVLAYSRIATKAGRRTLVDTEELLGEVLRPLRLAIQDNDVQITHDPLPSIMADRMQFLQVFQNLLLNAIKFRSSVPPRIHLSAREQSGHWLFSVQDNGIGFPVEAAQRIFVIFQRLQDRTVEGSGVGLAICKRIIELHGGRIWAESTPGEGSVFYFTVPKS